MNPDFVDFLAELLAAKARFLIVGAHALAAHGLPRATGDMDVWIERSPDNAARVLRALAEFGAPIDDLGVKEKDLQAPDVVIQIGLAPRRIDLLTDVSGLKFKDAWASRATYQIDSLSVPFLSRDDLVRNKRATHRHKDLGDIEALGEQGDEAR